MLKITSTMRHSPLIVLTLAATFAHAGEEKNYGLDLVGQRDHQPYQRKGSIIVVPVAQQPGLTSQTTTGQIDADLTTKTTTLQLMPWLRAGNWELSAQAPYEKITTSGQLTYNGPAGYTVLPGSNGESRLVFLKPGESKPVNSEAEGWADVSLQMKRWFGQNKPWQGYIGGVVKLDNGDQREGLGTGAVDYSAELGLLGNFRHATISLVGGHTWVGQPDNAPELDDVDYASVDLRLAPNEPLSLGVSYDWQPSPWPSTADQRYSTLYAELTMADVVHVRGYYKHYDQAPEGLEDATGVSLTLSF